MIVVGITGELGSGKDTVFRALSLHHDVCRVALADPGKAFWNVRDDLHKAMPLPDSPTMRKLWQVSLTEDREEAGVPSLWVDLLKWQIMTLHNRLGYEKFVVTDVRRDYEASGMNVWVGNKFRGWCETWKIVSPNAGGGADSWHISETGVARVPFDRQIANDGTIQDLVAKVLLCWDEAERVACAHSKTIGRASA